ncbi:MAG: hypothetical protein IPJ65_11870 [Archangiaceae bacterium]|nr:hypothetical protein [Archangiaceae bacterium]
MKLPQLNTDDFLCAETRDAILPGFPLEAVPTWPRSAEAVLEELRTHALLPPEWLSVTFDEGRLDARGLLSRDTFFTVAPALVSLCRAAAPYGAGGTLLMVGLGALSFGYSVRCAFGRSSVRIMSADAVNLMRESPAVEALRQSARGSLEALLGDGAGAPFTGA